MSLFTTRSVVQPRHFLRRRGHVHVQGHCAALIPPLYELLNFLVYTYFLEQCVSWWAKCWQRETAWNPSCRKTWLMLSGFTSVLWCGYRLWNKPWSIPRAVSTIRLFCCRYHRLYMKFLGVIQNKSRKTLFFSETRSHLENQDLIKVL